MIESDQMDDRRVYLPEKYNVNYLSPSMQAPYYRSAQAGRAKIEALMPLVRKAVAGGDDDALQGLMAAARNDPRISALIPAGFDIETRSPGHLRISAPLDDDQLSALYRQPADVYVKRRIGEAPPGRYAYTVQDGFITGF